MSTAARGFGRASQQKDDVRRAEQALDLLHEDMEELDRELRIDIEELGDKYSIEQVEMESIDIPPRKSDLKTQDTIIVWTPWQVDRSGIAAPLFEILSE